MAEAREGVRLVTVEAADAGVRLDRWLRRRVPGLSQGWIERLARTGQIRIDGGRVRADARLRAGARVRIPPLAPAPVPRAPERLGAAERAFVRSLVIFEDHAVLALNKPAGLAAQGGSKTREHLDRLLPAFGEGESRPRLAHRLDRDTSGVLVLGKTPAATAALAAAFAGREAHKTYLAIVAGAPFPRRGAVDLPLAKRGHGEREIMQAVDASDADARPAVTRYATLGTSGDAALVELSPLTGRTHQLRAHMRAIGHPILGDRKYGDPASIALSAELGLQLHALRLSIPHPSGGRLELEAPPGEALMAGLARFGFSLGGNVHEHGDRPSA